MPNYIYRCPECQHVWEYLAKLDRRDSVVCPDCGDVQAERLPAAPGIAFKGAGWYVTDYGNRRDGDE